MFAFAWNSAASTLSQPSFIAMFLTNPDTVASEIDGVLGAYATVQNYLFLLIN